MTAKICLIGCATLVIAQRSAAQDFHPDIPKAWDDREVERFELPLAQRDRSPKYLSSKEYYALKVREVYRTYPLYADGHVPAGYMEALKQKDPEIVIFDSAHLRTEADWIRAGEEVFYWSPTYRAADRPGRSELSAKNGIHPYSRYVIRKKGAPEQTGNSCAACHVRILPDGTGVMGAQLDIATEHNNGASLLAHEITPEVVTRNRDLQWLLSGAPWVRTREEFEKIPFTDIARMLETMQAGVRERQGTGPDHPVHVPSLIGIKDLRYLDATGLVRHRSVADLMRYAAVNYGLDLIAHYGDFQPSPIQAHFGLEGTRFSDEQLFALALYVYSLRPPPNPNPFDERARRGQTIFQQQGCAGCHPGPLYTNNKLSPAPGFRVPEDLQLTDDTMSVSVGTDPALATQTRRGTGFYKVPSLRGVWYRTAFSHSGQADTLEEWFDPARLKTDYVPKGFHVGPGPIKGHEFGLKLSPADRQALIAFLNTL